MRAEKAQRKLSKPRSLRHSTTSQGNLSIDPVATSATLAQSVADFLEVGGTAKTRNTKRSKSRSRIQNYLYGSHGKATLDASSDEDTGSPSSHASETPKKAKNRISRAESFFTQRSSVTSSTILLSQGQVAPAKPNDDEVIDDTEAVATQIKQRAQHDIIVAGNHKSSALDDETFGDSFLPPIRRKSLFTPGLATRNTSDILRKPSIPSADDTQSSICDTDMSYYYNRTRSEESPLSCLAALKLPDDGRGTPSSLNVPNMGGLRPGTLHVTNGAGSPMPLSPRPVSICSSPTISQADREDFQTASEGSIHDGLSTHSSEQVVSPKPSQCLISADGGGFDQTGLAAGSTSKDVAAADPSLLSSSIALDYIAELESGPYSPFDTCSRPISPVQRRSELDRGTVSNALQQPASGTHCSQTTTTVSVLYPRYDHERPTLVTLSSGPLLATSDTITTTTSVTTGDSGYHSRESLDLSARTKSAGDNGIQDHQFMSDMGERGHEAALIDLDNDSALRFRGDSMVNSTPLTAKARGRKLQKARREKKTKRASESLGHAMHDSTGPSIPRVPSAMASRHAQRLIDFPALDHTYPSLEHVRVEAAVSLHEARPLVLQFPEPLPTNPVCPKRHMQSGTDEEACGSQFIHSRPLPSSGSPEKSANSRRIVRKAEETRRREERNRSKRLEQEAEEREREAYGGVKSSTWRSRASSMVRGKSKERRTSHYDASGIIADFGTVAHSIGCSPYDIATVISPRARHDGPGYFPHQLGAVRPRPRSFIGMDDSTASDLAHARSRLRQRPVQGRPKSMCLDTLARKDISTANPTTLPTGTYVQGQDRQGLSTTKQPFRAYSQIPGDDEDAPAMSRRRMPLDIPLHSPPQVSMAGELDQTSAEVRHQNMPMCESTGLMHGQGTLYRKRHGSERPEATNHNAYSTSSRDPHRQVLSAGDEDTIHWETSQSAWRQRRKSAGHALLATQLASDAYPKSNAEDRQQHAAQSPQIRKDMSPSRRPAVSPAIAALAGRYEGGFDFGFQHGCGVGGSAGTRNVGNSAARKSGDVSKGYGLDLSDLPVFITPASGHAERF